MNEQTPMTGRPARLLLATDLSARCDRALDRAMQLAREWRAEIVVLHVLEGPQPPDQTVDWPAREGDVSSERVAKRQIEREFAGTGIPVSLYVVRGEVAGAVHDLAATADCGLIVTGMARSEIFGRFLVGTTAARLARSAPQPLLVVRNRVHDAYRRVVVATDFSDSSRHALHAAARLFPERELILYHAYEIPFSGVVGEVPHDRIARDIEQGECAEFLAASTLPAAVRSRLQVVIEHGPLETALTRYVREEQVDLAVVGTHGRSGLMHVLLGSTAARLLDWLPCDTLIVREPRAAT